MFQLSLDAAYLLLIFGMFGEKFFYLRKNLYKEEMAVVLCCRNCCDLVNGILSFLVQLSSSRHHTKQIIELPKLIQLCDGLMAAGAHAECIAGLAPVAVKVFSNMGGWFISLKILWSDGCVNKPRLPNGRPTFHPRPSLCFCQPTTGGRTKRVIYMAYIILRVIRLD